MSARIAAVLFDLDGVLLDSESVWDAARRELAVAYRVPYPHSATRDVMGMSAPEWSRYIRDVLGVPLSTEEIGREVLKRMEAAYRKHLPLEPGAVDAVRRIGARWPLGMASSSNRELIELFVELSGLRGAFATIVSSEEVARGKPSPDVYLRAAENLGVEPRACVAIEDSSNGIRAAKAAGTYVVAIPNRSFPPPASVVELANIRLGSLAELTPPALEAMVAQAT